MQVVKAWTQCYQQNRISLPSFEYPTVSAIGPGDIQTILTLSGPHSTAKCLVIASTKHNHLNLNKKVVEDLK